MFCAVEEEGEPVREWRFTALDIDIETEGCVPRRGEKILSLSPLYRGQQTLRLPLPHACTRIGLHVQIHSKTNRRMDYIRSV